MYRLPCACIAESCCVAVHKSSMIDHGEVRSAFAYVLAAGSSARSRVMQSRQHLFIISRTSKRQNHLRSRRATYQLLSLSLYYPASGVRNNAAPTPLNTPHLHTNSPQQPAHNPCSHTLRPPTRHTSLANPNSSRQRPLLRLILRSPRILLPSHNARPLELPHLLQARRYIPLPRSFLASKRRFR